MAIPESSDVNSGRTDCPNEQALSRLLEDSSDANTVHLVAHVETCAACQQVLEELSDDTDEVRLPESQLPEYLCGLAPQLADESVHASAESPLFTLPGFEILELVGRGGMGAVYRARHEQLDREVAVKVIAAGAHAGIEYRERLDREGRLVAKIDHPHIVRIFDSGQHGDLPYLVLEFMDSGSLAEWRTQLTDPHEIARLIELLARAVHAAHTIGIIHRDLKPGNILLAEADASDSTIELSGRNFIPRIADFGLSKQVLQQHDVSNSTGMLGTPGYMAPEQATESSADIGSATDIHALGIVLYELLAKRRPFDGKTTLDTIDQIRSQPAGDLIEQRSDIPQPLADICHQCLQKKSTDRYESALQLANELARFRAGDPLQHTEQRSKMNVAKFLNASLRTTGISRKHLTSSFVWLTLATVGVLLWTVISVQTNRGTVVIDTDEAIKIEIRRNNRTVESFEVANSPKTRTVYSGDIEIVIPAEVRDRFTVSNTRFELTRNDRQVVTIRRAEPSPPVYAAAEFPAPAANSSEREIVEWLINRGASVRLEGHVGGFHSVAELPDGVPAVNYLLARKGTGLRSKHLSLLTRFPNLQVIQIFECDIGNNLSALNDVPKLHSLSLHGCPINDQQWAVFDNYDKLRWLGTAGTQISSVFLERLRGGKLQTLDVTEQQILHSKGVEFLQSAKSLRTLGLFDFTDASADLVRAVPNLREIRCHDGLGSAQTIINAIGEARGLERLKFWRTDLRDVDFSPLQSLPNLVWIELMNVNLAPAKIAEIEEMFPNADLMHSVERNIDSLVAQAGGTMKSHKGERRQTQHPTRYSELVIDEITFIDTPLLRDEHFIPYQHLKHLKSLTVNRAGIDGSTLKNISHLKTLECLSLSETRVSDRHIGFLAELTGLKRLDLKDTRVTARGLAGIATLQELESLAIDGLQITRSMVDILHNLRKLRHLQVGRASNTTIEQVSSLNQLETLTIDESYTVTEACLPSLTKMQNLKTLTLGTTNIPRHFLAQLRAKLPNCSIETTGTVR